MNEGIRAGIIIGFSLIASLAPATEEKELSPVATAAVKELPHVLNGVAHPDLEGLSKDNYVISDTLAAGGAATLGEYARKVYSDTRIADEIATGAMERRDGTITKLPQTEISKMRVLAVQPFEISDGGYDWTRLKEEFPSVRAVICISEPALDASGTYGAVRYEVWTRNGRAWAGYQFFELRNDTWRATKLIVGKIR